MAFELFVVGLALTCLRPISAQNFGGDECPPGYVCFEQANILRHDLKHIKAKTLQACADVCDTVPGCTSWTLVEDNCWLKSATNQHHLQHDVPTKNNERLVSGFSASIKVSPRRTVPGFNRVPINLAATLSPELGFVVGDGEVSFTHSVLRKELWYELTETFEECVRLCHLREVWHKIIVSYGSYLLLVS